MYEDARVPKDPDLIRIFQKLQSIKPKPEVSGKSFDDVLKSVQIKIEKKSLENLRNSPIEKAHIEIDSASAKEALDLLQQTVDFLKNL